MATRKKQKINVRAIIFTRLQKITELKAWEIYKLRLRHNIPGDHLTDWRDAELYYEIKGW